MFCFKPRTLLIATALVAVFLGLQVHVHFKAKRFVEEVNAEPSRQQFAEHIPAEVFPATYTDVIRIQRRAKVHLSISEDGELIGFEIFNVGIFGQPKLSRYLIERE